jgi:hypothetical protein
MNCASAQIDLDEISDAGRACSQLSGMVDCLRHLAERRIIVGVLTRFKSNEKLQAEALDILTEMIRRELLTVSVWISDPSIHLSCPVREAIVAGSRSTTQKEIMIELITGQPIKKKGGPGIDLLINEQFRLPTDQEAQVRDQLAKMGPMLPTAKDLP